MKQWHLAFLTLAVLALAGFLWMRSNEEPGDQVAVILCWLACVVAAQMPAVWLRMRGASSFIVFLTAVAVPLIPIEILLGIAAKKFEHSGGDLQGIELLMMGLAVPFVIIPAVIMTALAALIPRDAE